MTEQIVYLNGRFIPKSEATISPMDRGFLFGDGIYEVIPCHGRRPIALERHLNRLTRNLDAISLRCNERDEWRTVILELISNSPWEHCGVYFHVSRGVAERRHHTFSSTLEPTVFAYTFDIPAPRSSDNPPEHGLKLKSQEDLRWQHCDIKVTALLGNVLHYQAAVNEGFDEALLYRQDGLLTEAAASNIFVVSGRKVMTPRLDQHLLPGITRGLVLDILRMSQEFEVTECDLRLADCFDADEVWLSSSTREIAPVSMIDSKPITARTGSVWGLAIDLFQQHKFEFA